MLDQNVHSREYWDDRYRKAGPRYVFGKAPDDLARMLYNFFLELSLPTGVELLDLGCGEGRDAVYLARRGFRVSAVDSSGEGLAKAAALAGEEGADVNFIAAEVASFGLDRPWPVVYANNVLQFLGRRADAWHRSIRENTAEGGWNVVSWFTDAVLSPNKYGALRILPPGELKERYAGWKIFYYGENVLYRPEGDHYLSFAKIIARKPPC